MKRIVIIDGYNLLHDMWLHEGKNETSLEDGRHTLFNLLRNYVGFLDLQVMVVYDGASTNTEVETFGRLQVVYAKKDETADTYIERMAYALVRQDYRVSVVTSDYEEQKSIFGSGATRLSAREFYAELKQTKTLEQVYLRDKKGQHNHLDGQLDDQIVERLQKMRRR